MKNLYPIILISIAAQTALLPLARASEAEDMLGIFDGGTTKFTVQSLIQEYAIMVPQQAQAPLIYERHERKPLYQILSEQEDGGNKKFYTPSEIAAMIREDYGDDPSEDDKKQIQKALSMLGGTKFGAEMCKEVAYNCTIEDLEKAGIRLRVKSTSYGENQSASGVVPPPIDYAGRTFIGLAKSNVSDTASPHQLAITILHEMSHVEDLRKNKLGSMEKALYASEEKALMTAIAGYDELSRKHSGFSDTFYDFLVEFWTLKNESGPYPKHQFFTLPLGPGGSSVEVSSGDLLKNYMQGLSYWDSMQHLVYNIWHSSYGNPKVDDEIVKAIRRAAWEKEVSYKNWRKNPSGVVPPTVVPTPTPTTPTPKPPKPPKPDHDNGGGDTGSGGGEWIPPFIPNPHF